MKRIKSISENYLNIYTTVQNIPPGRVTTYGRIAAACGLSGHARMVGYALHALPKGPDIPWHRIVNARGMISRLPDPDSGNLQRRLLEAEGIEFDEKGTIDLNKFSYFW